MSKILHFAPKIAAHQTFSKNNPADLLQNFLVREDMIIKKNDIPTATEYSSMGGEGTLHLNKMSAFDSFPKAVSTFARATLEVGSSVGFHVHETNSEAYYFLSGVGEYDDNGVKSTVTSGDFTYTPCGEGHGIKNVGDTPLEFIALIINNT